MKTGRPTKPPWEVTWNTYNSKLHLIGSFYNEEHKRFKVRTGTRDHFKALQMVTVRMEELKNIKVSLTTSMTLEQAFKRMTEEVWKYQKDQKKRIREAERISEWFGQNFLLKDIDEDMLSKFESYLRGIDNHGATINRKMAIIKATLNKAFKFWRLIDRVPAFLHHKEKVGGHKREILESELKLLMFYADYEHSLIFELMFQTGMRVSECFYLSLEMLDVENCTIKIVDSKTGEDETIIVPSEIFGRLKIHLEEHETMITDESRVRTQWNKGRKILGLMDDPKFTAGALRHTFALQLIREGKSAPVVQAFLRHKTIITTQHYFQQNKQELLRIRDERESQ